MLHWARRQGGGGGVAEAASPGIGAEDKERRGMGVEQGEQRGGKGVVAEAAFPMGDDGQTVGETGIAQEVANGCFPATILDQCQIKGEGRVGVGKVRNGRLFAPFVLACEQE